MIEKSISHEFRLKDRDDVRNCFLIKETEKNELMSKKHKKRFAQI